jgi:hypothetical protein
MLARAQESERSLQVERRLDHLGDLDDQAYQILPAPVTSTYERHLQAMDLPAEICISAFAG